jgi:hypothetical protein
LLVFWGRYRQVEKACLYCREQKAVASLFGRSLTAILCA